MGTTEPGQTGRQVRLERTVAMIAEALERRRRKIAAGIPVDPPLRCSCREHRKGEHT